MTRSTNTPVPHQDRWQAVNPKQHHPEWALRQIACKIGRSQAFVRKWSTHFELHGSVADQPRSDRPQNMSTAVVQQAMIAAQQKECKTASAIAARVQQQSGLTLSVSTVTRSFRKHWSPAPQTQVCAQPVSQNQKCKGSGLPEQP